MYLPLDFHESTKNSPNKGHYESAFGSHLSDDLSDKSDKTDSDDGLGLGMEGEEISISNKEEIKGGKDFNITSTSTSTDTNVGKSQFSTEEEKMLMLLLASELEDVIDIEMEKTPARKDTQKRAEPTATEIQLSQLIHSKVCL